MWHVQEILRQEKAISVEFKKYIFLDEQCQKSTVEKIIFQTQHEASFVDPKLFYLAVIN